MLDLKGRSGCTHRFSEAETSTVPDGLPGSTDVLVERVADTLDRPATVTDVVASYAKALDVGARVAELCAPSFDVAATSLAAEYGLRLTKSDPEISLSDRVSIPV